MWEHRTIDVESDAGKETQLQTFWHEVTHVALWDGGCHDALTHEQREAVCNAMGTYMAAAMIGGYLRFPARPRGR